MVPAISNGVVNERSSYPEVQPLGISSEMLAFAGEILKFHHTQQQPMAMGGPALLGRAKGLCSSTRTRFRPTELKFLGFSQFSTTVNFFQ